MGNLVISYDKSNKDVPVLVVAREGFGGVFCGASINVVRPLQGMRLQSYIKN